MTDIRKCENVVYISVKCKGDQDNLHVVLSYCMHTGIVFEYLQNKHGTEYAIVIGNNNQLKEVLEICMDKYLEARIRPNKSYIGEEEPF